MLAAVGAKMREVLRGSDLKCRYGGEEFLVLLPETPLEGAKRVADTLRRELSELPITWKDESLSVTASFGVSVALPAEIDAKAIIGRADAALYRAKDQGRNCVRLARARGRVAERIRDSRVGDRSGIPIPISQSRIPIPQIPIPNPDSQTPNPDS